MIATKPLDLRSNLKKYMDYAFSGEPVVIARPKNENVVMLSEKEYNELLKARQNVEYLARIDSSYEQLEKIRPSLFRWMNCGTWNRIIGSLHRRLKILWSA